MMGEGGGGFISAHVAARMAKAGRGGIAMQFLLSPDVNGILKNKPTDEAALEAWEEELSEVEIAFANTGLEQL